MSKAATNQRHQITKALKNSLSNATSARISDRISSDQRDGLHPANRGGLAKASRTDEDPDPISAGTAGDAALWGGSSEEVGMETNPLGAHQLGRGFADRVTARGLTRTGGTQAADLWARATGGQPVRSVLSRQRGLARARTARVQLDSNEISLERPSRSTRHGHLAAGATQML